MVHSHFPSFVLTGFLSLETFRIFSLFLTLWNSEMKRILSLIWSLGWLFQTGDSYFWVLGKCLVLLLWTIPACSLILVLLSFIGSLDQFYGFFFFLFTILFVFSDSLVFCSTFSAMSSILTLNHLIDIFILDVLWWQISKSSFLPSYHSLCSNIFFCLTKDIIYNLCEIFSTFALFLSLLCSFQLFVFVFSFHVGGRLNRKVLT